MTENLTYWKSLSLDIFPVSKVPLGASKYLVWGPGSDPIWLVEIGYGSKIKSLDFFPFFLHIEFGQIKQKVENFQSPKFLFCLF